MNKVLRIIKNFIGRTLKYAECSICRDSFRWKKWQTINYSKSEGCFAVCKECFNKEDTKLLIFEYTRLCNEGTYVQGCVMTAEHKQSLATLEKNIRILKTYGDELGKTLMVN